MKHQVFISILFLCSLPISNLKADEHKKLNFIGFSKDGSSLAFEVFGEGSSGFHMPNSKIIFVDVKNNKYLTRPFYSFSSNEDEKGDYLNLREVREESIEKSKIAIEKYGIIKGNQGTLINASSNPGDKIQYLNFTNQSGEKSRAFKIILEELGTSEYNSYDEELKMIKLSLVGEDIGLHREIVLQEDKFIPSSRGNPTSYYLSNIFSYKNSIACFIDVCWRGYEGGDCTYMVVTGILP